MAAPQLIQGAAFKFKEFCKETATISTDLSYAFSEH